jgi:hypothetical protein
MAIAGWGVDRPYVASPPGGPLIGEPPIQIYKLATPLASAGYALESAKPYVDRVASVGTVFVSATRTMAGTIPYFYSPDWYLPYPTLSASNPVISTSFETLWDLDEFIISPINPATNTYYVTAWDLTYSVPAFGLIPGHNYRLSVDLSDYDSVASTTSVTTQIHDFSAGSDTYVWAGNHINIPPYGHTITAQNARLTLMPPPSSPLSSSGGSTEDPSTATDQ